MSKPALALLASAALAGCGTVIDFGPEPGTIGDESYLHYQPELHGPDAPPREAPRDGIRIGESSDSPVPAEPAAAAPAAAAPAPIEAAPVLPPPPPAPAIPAAPTSEALFNDAIRRAVDAGDIDRALKLLEEAERLGSPSARPTFIEAIQSRGN